MKYLIVIALLGMTAIDTTDTVVIKKMEVVQSDLDSIKIQMKKMITQLKNDTI